MHAQRFAIGHARLTSALDCRAETDAPADSFHVWTVGDK